jgi:hypothetical protein
MIRNSDLIGVSAAARMAMATRRERRKGASSIHPHRPMLPARSYWNPDSPSSFFPESSTALSPQEEGGGEVTAGSILFNF